MSVRWNGKKVLSNLRRAQIKAINQTMAAAEIHAIKGHVPSGPRDGAARSRKRWWNQTGDLEGSIDTRIPARPHGKGVSGLWGSADIDYALVQELGSEKKNIPARPYLRPAADAEYPKLARRIRRAMA